MAVDRFGVARTFLLIRCAYWLGAAVTLLWAPIRDDAAQPPFRAWLGVGDWLFDTFAQWDSVWFLHIADHGYDREETYAFFPLYPLLVRGLAEVVRSEVAAAVILSLASGAVAAVLLHKLSRPLLGDAGARDSVLLFALYPIAFVVTAAYSEGLFLALAIGAVLAGAQQRALLAGVLGGLACSTRLVGLALLPALVIQLWPSLRRLLPLLLLPAGVAAYALYLERHTGDAWAFLHVQGAYWNRHVHALGPLSGLWLGVKSGYQGAVEILRHLPRAPHGTFEHKDQWASWNVVNLLLLVAALWLTWVAWKRIGAALAAYSLALLLIVLTSPAELVPLVSLPRFLLSDFPLFIVLAALAATRPRLRASLLVGFAAIGGAAAAAFAHHVWIA